MRLNAKGQVKLYRSLVKYSFNNHIFEIIEECEIEILNERERYWQDYYDVLNKNGLNLKTTSTKTKSGNNSKETNEKISKSLLGHTVSERCKQISSERNKGNKHCLGYKHTEEFLNTLRKPILQYNKENIFIKEWSSIKEVAFNIISKNNNLKSKCNSINNCLSGTTNTAGGFKWKYKNNN